MPPSEMHDAYQPPDQFSEADIPSPDVEDELLLTSDEHYGDVPSDDFHDDSYESEPDTDTESVPVPVAYAVDRPAEPERSQAEPPAETPVPASPELRLLTLADLGSVALEPYQLVEGIGGFKDFRAVEKHVCAELSPNKQDADVNITYARETISGKPIDDYARPKGFNGHLVNGQVIIMPFDSVLAVSQDTRLVSGRGYWGQDFNDRYKGLTVTYAGNLYFPGVAHRTDTAIMPLLTLETTYFIDKSAQPYRSGNRADRVRRTMGKPEVTVGEGAIQLDNLIQIRNLASRLNALYVQRYNTTHPFHGGSLGGGKVGGKGGHK